MTLPDRLFAALCLAAFVPLAVVGRLWFMVQEACAFSRTVLAFGSAEGLIARAE